MPSEYPPEKKTKNYSEWQKINFLDKIFFWEDKNKWVNFRWEFLDQALVHHSLIYSTLAYRKYHFETENGIIRTFPLQNRIKLNKKSQTFISSIEEFNT
jgi:hypothetical protein